jgi:hypothetical protein
MVPEWPVEFERARQLIDDAVRKHITNWAKIVGLSLIDTSIDQFRDDVTKALHAGMQTHIVGSAGDLDKEFRKEVREKFLGRYCARHEAIKKLREAFAPCWPPSYYEFQAWMDLTADPKAHEHDLEALAEAMRLEADASKSTRGRPSTMKAFNALAEGLILAYRRATGWSGRGRSAKEGKLHDFVKSVSSVAARIAKAVTGESLVTPTGEDGLGQALFRAAQRLGGHNRPQKL